MNKRYSYIIILVTLLIFGCKKEQDLSNIDETIYVRHRGADMPVYLRGNANSKVIVLVVHGGPGGNGLEYRTGTWTVPLEKNYAMAYWDQRGQGMSHGKYDNISVKLVAQDMDAVVRTLKHKFGDDTKVFAYGHSWGGTVTAEYMLSNQIGYVDGWISSNGAHDMPKNNIESVKLFRKVAAEQIALRNNIDKWQEIKTWANGIDTNNITDAQSLEINQKGFEVEEWLIEDGVLNARTQGGNSGAGIFSPINPVSSNINGTLTNLLLSGEIKSTSYTDDLDKINLPLLVITGKYDFVVAPQLGNDLYSLANSANKTIAVFDKSGHSPMTHEPSKYSNLIIQFIEASR